MSTDTVQALSFPTLSNHGQEVAFAAAEAAGHAAGYSAGLAAARAQAQMETARAAQASETARVAAAVLLDQQLATLSNAAMAMHLKAAPVVEAVHAQLMAGALTVATALLGQELADGDTSARSALARALSAAGDEVPVAVRLSPADLTALNGAAAAASTTVTLIADASLTRGDAIAEYASGFLDARLSTAVERARLALKVASV